MRPGKTHEGHLSASGKRFALLATRWNSFIVDHLIEGAIDTIRRHGGSPDEIEIFMVPGAFELPIVAQKVARSGRFDAIVVLGAVIRGATPHFDYVANEATKGLAQVGLDAGIPIGFGLLTVDSIEQAIERAGTKAGNKGGEAALAAIEVVDLFSRIDGAGAP
ncbi:MAG: 6,7-dimethyl-8-ribityllumazine synthase [Myxococcota bacterium]|nr:6,7-dimethyl-8-ribityllumazine synthase [Myxococcota bacterium]